VHLALGLSAVAAACSLMLAAWAGAGTPARQAIAAVLLGLVGMGAGVTSGHLFKVVPMLVWTGRFAHLAGTPGAPRLADLYPGGLAVVEQAAFAAGLALLVGGAAAGSGALAAAGAGLLVVAALAVATAVGACVLRRPSVAPRGPAPPAASSPSQQPVPVPRGEIA
jgi:hypothetical protein